MSIAISANGFAKKLSERAALKPRPLVEGGGYPKFLCILKVYFCDARAGFVILRRYKGRVIKVVSRVIYLIYLA